MTEVVGVKFKNTMKMYYFDPAGLEINTDQPVIVETSRGVEYAMCTMKNTMVEDDKIVTPLKKVIRIATAEDTKNVEENAKKEGRALEICKQKVLEHKLDMKFVGVEYSFDGSKIVFYFTADGRVDFRELVKDLASIFHTRIELRQIGVRDEAKLLGGLGICGRALCCSEFLDTFHPVSIKMAKEQNLSLNPTKISGTCGRLMCCLKHEHEAYEDLLRNTPKLDSTVQTPDGPGTVIEANLLRGIIKVRLDSAQDSVIKLYKKEDLKWTKAMKGPKKEETPDEADTDIIFEEDI